MQNDDAKSNFCNFDRQSIPHGAEKRKSGFLLCKPTLPQTRAVHDSRTGKREKPAPQRDAGSGLQVRSAVLAHLCEALAAVDRTIGLRLEGNTSFAAAVGADSSEVLSRAAGSILASVTAGLAALGLILEASLRVELLLTGGEHGFGAAFLSK